MPGIREAATMKKVYGEIHHDGVAFAITSPNFANNRHNPLTISKMSKVIYETSFLGKDVLALVDRNGRIVGWDSKKMAEYNGARQ